MIYLTDIDRLLVLGTTETDRDVEVRHFIIIFYFIPGLENIFLMTYREKYQLSVEMEDFDKGSACAQYSLFYIDPESTSYILHIGRFINGGAGEKNTTGYDLPADIYFT